MCLHFLPLRKELKLRSSIQGPAARAFVFSRSCSTALVFILLLTHEPCCGPSPGQIRHPSIDHSPSHCVLNFHSQRHCHSAHFITPILSRLLCLLLQEKEKLSPRSTAKPTKLLLKTRIPNPPPIPPFPPVSQSPI